MLLRLSSLLLKTRAAASAQVGNGLGLIAFIIIGFVVVARVVLIVVVVAQEGEATSLCIRRCRLLRVAEETFFAFSLRRKRRASCSLPW